MVFGAVEMAAAYGRERLDRSGIQSLGIDGIAWGRGHRPLIVDWFGAKSQLSSGVVEGFNGKAKLTTRKAYGFRTCHGLKVPLIMHLAPYSNKAYPQIVVTTQKPLLIGYRAGRGGASGSARATARAAGPY